MENLVFSGESVPIEVASQVMKKTPSYIRQGLIQKVLPFGYAMKKPGATRYSYYISPKKFYECTGYLYTGDTEWVSFKKRKNLQHVDLKYFY